LHDIVRCVQEIRGNICYLCKKTSAAVKCEAENCDRWWHFICGRSSNCITQFTGEFQCYCDAHVPDMNRIKHNGTRCSVCDTFIGGYHPATSIFSNCCYESVLKLGITSEELMTQCFVCNVCIQKYCCNAGYDARCVTCNSKEKEEWQNQMRLRGIFVPMQMASWEQDGRFDNQSMQNCKNPDCKNPWVTKDVWTCRVCGCDPQHLKCAGVDSFEEYLCAKCVGQSFLELLKK
jgi:PHD-like zinc-binding domain